MSKIMATSSQAATTMESSNKTNLKENHEDLVNRLDELLETYLGLLHNYTEARSRLSQSFSQGFMSLAQANFTSSSRVRYGADYYDDRMQASRLVKHDEGSVVVEQVQKQAEAEEAEQAKKDEPKDAETDEVEVAVEKGKGGEKASDDPIDHEDAEDNKQVQAKEKSSKHTDPLRWFGILVPPALRSAQASFAEATEDAIPSIVNVNAKMEALEIEVRRTRKKIAKLTPTAS